jgi:hypothetical protein
MATTDIVFPHPILDKVHGDPNRGSLQTLKKQLFANARAVSTNLGGGTYGHLALLMTDAEYLTLPNAAAFPPPVHPGPQPAHADGATQHVINQANRLYDTSIATFRLHASVSEHLKKQILTAVDNKYLHALEDETMGFATVTPAAMLAHLFTTYGTIKPTDLDDNIKLLLAPWVPEHSLEDLWKRTRDCQAFATAGGEAISNDTAMRHLLTVFKNTGVFATAIDKWKDKPLNARTMITFQAHFKEENDRRIENTTSAQAGFHGANAAFSAIPVPVPLVANAAQAPIAPTTTTPPSSLPVGATVVYYCWSHGIGFSPGHTSITCRAPKPGHCPTATIRNLQGGTATIMQRTRRNTRPPSAPST